MVQVTCYYLKNSVRPEEDISLIFIRYDKFFKIMLNNKSIIISIENLIYDLHLYGYYILSVILTENPSNNYNRLSVLFDVNMKYFSDGYYEVFLNKNPWRSREPIRNTSTKKIKKFLKNLFTYLPTAPTQIIDDYIRQEFLLPQSEIYHLEN